MVLIFIGCAVLLDNLFEQRFYSTIYSNSGFTRQSIRTAVLLDNLFEQRFYSTIYSNSGFTRQSIRTAVLLDNLFELRFYPTIYSNCSFTRQSIRTAGKTAHVLKVANIMINLKNTKLLSFLYIFEVLN